MQTEESLEDTIVKELNEIDAASTTEIHQKADDLLLRYLRSINKDNVADAWEKAEKRWTLSFRNS